MNLMHRASSPTAKPHGHPIYSGPILMRVFALLFLLGSLCTARADGQDDEYFRIYGIIEQADTLSANGKADSARAKYQEAQKALTEFKRLNPLWNTKAVAYRLNYLAGKVAPPPDKTVPPSSNTNAKAANLPAGVQIKLINAGGEPRRALRFHPQPGDKQSLGMTMKITMEMGAAGAQMPSIKMPAMQLGMDVVVQSVSSEGDIAYQTTMTEASMAEDADASPQMAGGFDAAMANIKGMIVTGIVTDRGVAKTVDFKLPPGADPQARQTMDQMKSAMSQVSLPEEAVGVGAKWEVKRIISTQGLMVDQTETYEVTALDGDAVTLRSGFAQHASNQKMESPAMPGMKVDVAKMETKGTGTATVDLGKLMPTAGAMDGHTEMSMSINMGNQKQAMTMKMDMTNKIEAK